MSIHLSPQLPVGMPHSHDRDQSEAEEEQVHFSNVITTFRNYAQYSLSANNRRRKDFFTLPKPDQELLAALGYKAKLDQVDVAILANADFLSEVVSDPEIFGHDLGSVDESDPPMESDSPVNGAVGHSHENLIPGGLVDLGVQLSSPQTGHSHSHGHTHSHSHDGPRNRRRYKPTDFDMDKLRSTLKQFVRDWSAEGRDEREACYKPMKDALLLHFSDVPAPERGRVRVLVPGTGLGRLAHDVAGLGFTCQGNEFSHYMLLSSHFILNRTTEINAYTIYPYVHSFSNVASHEALMRPITIPDVLPSDLPDGVNFSLVAGDFEEIYGTQNDASEPQSGQWDAVLTCFFIDTAKNIANYLRIIHSILAPGGVWINMGPLLWHWENNTTNDPSIELSLEEVKALARAIGFRISNEHTIDTTYTSNAQGMLGYVYHAAFWTATKV
ncbi:N2227-domain-containing protein [Mycena albidolilacea]|uniref:carnosine N-methyltransferase n=1 Tax=Mycena albidolilacea TaxID=1033008 RepID=A0AAD7A955_9AGAR|nr:N2227-domain-containing protein [Mycena albidolilacea]